MLRLRNILNDISRTHNHAGIHQITRGIEKESLRITPNGKLATTPHPSLFGSPLTHPNITTDYCESMVEFITEPNTDPVKVLTQLEELHIFSTHNLPTEQLWPVSMPCELVPDAHIPAAKYGSSNIGKLKSIYRVGLGNRYGRFLTIAGLHYNFSVSDELWQFLYKDANSQLSFKDFKTDGYLKLIRNFLRNYWLLLYLFGASPCTSKNFLDGKQHDLQDLEGCENTLYSPHATSLRMSDLGFKSNAQDNLLMTYNCLENYIRTLCSAITQPHSRYTNNDLKNSDGHYQQLNQNLLQIENEFYSVVRPKRTTKKGENGLSALTERGIEYVEIRCLDLNPFTPNGITHQQIQFLDTFLLYCLLTDSPALTQQDIQDIRKNQQIVAYNGRDKNLELIKNGQYTPLQSWSNSLFNDLQLTAQLLDDAEHNKTASNTQNTTYSRSVEKEYEKIKDSTLTPSAQILSTLKQQKLEFSEFSMNLSNQYKFYFETKKLNNACLYKSTVEQSVQQQQYAESKVEINFEDYLREYYLGYTQLLDSNRNLQ